MPSTRLHVVDEVVIAQREQVSAVEPLWGRGQIEQEPRTEVAEQPPVGSRGCMVKLVDHDVVELVGVESVEPPGQCLHAGEHDAGTGVLLGPGEQPEVGVGLDPAEHVAALAKDLFAVRDEQDPPKRRTRSVERGKPRLAKPRRHDDQTSGVTGVARLFQGEEGFALDWPRRRRRRGRFRWYLARY
jgi:hypothetical protein